MAVEAKKRTGRTVKEKKEVAPEAEATPVTQPKPEPVTINPPAEIIKPPDNSIIWERKLPKTPKRPVKRACIVIDKYQRSHNVMVDLKGVDASEFTWGYYGNRYPVLTERDGVLVPFCKSTNDEVGESSNRLFKAAHPEGFKSTFRHRSSLLHKLQVGLMVALVLAIMFLIYILISQ